MSLQQKLSLLKLLLQHERERLETWARPLDQHAGQLAVPSSAWQQHAETAWTIDPRIALALLDRCSHRQPMQRNQVYVHVMARMTFREVASSKICLDLSSHILEGG